MTLNLITLAAVKTYLGLADTTYDARITAMIPIVSNDVRRILNTNFDTIIDAVFDETSTNLLVYYDLEMGQIVQHPELPDLTYITDYNPITGIYTLSATPTDSGNYIYKTLKISQLPTVAKMIFYRISTTSINDVSKKNVSSISYGSVSKTFSDSEINKQYNYPQTLINDLGKPFLNVG